MRTQTPPLLKHEQNTHKQTDPRCFAAPVWPRRRRESAWAVGANRVLAHVDRKRGVARVVGKFAAANSTALCLTVPARYIGKPCASMAQLCGSDLACNLRVVTTPFRQLGGARSRKCDVNATVIIGRPGRLFVYTCAPVPF
jgi:hypothetical protein